MAARGNDYRILWTIGLLILAVALLVPAGSALAATQILSRFGPDGTDATTFQRVASVGIDQGDGSVYALDAYAGDLYKFDSAGQPVDFGGASAYLSGNRLEGLDPFTDEDVGDPSVAQVAIDANSHRIYVTEKQGIRAFEADGEPAEFTTGPGSGTSEIPGFTELYGVAVDGEGNIYASDYNGQVSIFSPAGAPITTVSLTEPHTLAVDDEGAVYVLTGSGELSFAIQKLTPSALPVSGSTTYETTANYPTQFPNGTVGFTITPTTHVVYVTEVFNAIVWVRKINQAGETIETIGKPGTETGSESLGARSQGIGVPIDEPEIAPGKTVEFYVGDVNGSTSQMAIFGSEEVIAPPTIDRLRVTKVTSDSAEFLGLVNPNTKATTYRFEYGLEDCSTSVCIDVPAGGASVGSGTAGVAVAQVVTGLVANTTYHYALVAENELGAGEPEEGTFTTQALGGGSELSDDRAWEMVSPANKRGGTLKGPGFGLIQASPDGEKISYLSRGSIEANTQGNRSLEVSSLLAQRNPGGWSSRDITPANVRTSGLAVGHESEYGLFSPDLSAAILEPRDGTGLSPMASERTPYRWEDSDPPVFTPLVTGKEGFANVPPGTEFGGASDDVVGKVSLVGADPSLEVIALASRVPLTEEAPEFGTALYLWNGGQLSPLSVLPSGEFVNASLVGSGPASISNAVSEAGDRVFWSTGGYGPGGNNLSALYLRDTQAGETIRLDVVRSGAGVGTPNPTFQGASPDGTVVFFTDSQQLTEDASSNGRDLYRCEIPLGSPSSGCATLTNLTAPGVGGEPADVQGVSGLSRAADTAFFVARGDLDSAVNEYGDQADPGQPNLYVWQQGEGVRFVATLAEQDSPVWGGETAFAEKLSATVSPSGRHLAFMSGRSLTDQPNLDSATGNPVQQVFSYDAALERLQCVSCDPSGAAPSGVIFSASATGPMVDPRSQWTGQRISATLPQPVAFELRGISLYRPRATLDSGRMFFNSRSSLVPADANGQWDVYEFEPLGIGSCSGSTGSRTALRSGDGCVSLVSSGTGSEEAAFLDSSVDGDDAFFITPAQLSVLDTDSELDVYDARVGGVAAKLTPNSECSGEGCRTSAPPPPESGLGSVTLSGHGNLKQGRKCPKGKMKVRRNGKLRCVSKKKANKGHHKQGNKGGQGR